MDLELFDAFDEKADDAGSSKATRIESDRPKQNDVDSKRPSNKKRNSGQLYPPPRNTNLKPQESVENQSSSSKVLVESTAPLAPSFELPSNPAKIYPFKLDTFQLEAVNYIERGESVLVAAHTSAGKTAVAEYAIAKSLKNKQRVIYTSPIKALSNQKYRDINEEFTDVGLMTGDITINPNATCLIMTTEILRSMLYRGSEVMREVAWVIYDEVHYMRDKERGVVWEESIILLPHKVRFVFLSATIPNAKEFVSWVTKIHHQPCHVVYTEYRPVPLQHFVFPSGAEGLFLVVDHEGNFREENFQRAMAALQAGGQGGDFTEAGGSKGKKKGAGKNGGKNGQVELFRIVRLVMDRGLDPCIVFSFSKRECEAYALKMSSMDFTSDDEKALITQVYMNALEALSEMDRHLPQVETLLPLLKRGIGIHHGGLLPILKEITEILFQEGLIKCLFATETFSIGINMPAKTVIFTQTQKFDGKDFRWLTSGEYIQMSGRAGRRGKDDRGIVIQMLDEKMEPDVAKNMLYGPADPLRSAYHVGYNMVLNMLRVEDADPENLLRSSFHQFQQEQLAPELEQQAEELQREAVAIEVSDEDIVGEYQAWSQQLVKVQTQMMDIMRKPQHCLPFLQPGRMMRILARDATATEGQGEDWGWGILVAMRKATNGSSVSNAFTLVGAGGGKGADADYVLDVLLPTSRSEGADDDKEPLRPFDGDLSTANGIVVAISLSALSGLSAVRLNLPRDLRNSVGRQGVLKALVEVKRRFETVTADLSAEQSKGIPLLDPKEDMAIDDPVFTELAGRTADLRNRLLNAKFHTYIDKADRLELYTRKMELLESARVLRQRGRESQTVAMREDLRRMKRVLRRLGYISDKGVLQTKGRFSCEITTGDELVLTDMVFDGIFNTMTPEEAVALLSCFVHKEPSKDEGKIPPSLQGPIRQLSAAARLVAKVSVDAKLLKEDEEDDYVKSFNTGLVEVTFAWASGANFIDICRMTEVFEGSIIRSIRRLEELLRQVASASAAIGNVELKDKFELGATKIRRGVVFAASLYL
eukprot:gene722-1392_t